MSPRKITSALRCWLGFIVAPTRRPLTRHIPYRFRPVLEACEDRTTPTPVITIAAISDNIEGGFGSPTTRLTCTETNGTLFVNYSLGSTPTAADDASTGDEDNEILGDVLTNDTGNDDLTTAVLDEPWFGAVDLLEDGSFTYTPPEDFFGTDQFTYEVTDEYGGTSTATVTITVDPIEDDPVIDAQEFTLSEGLPNGTIVGFVEAHDPDSDQTLTYSITAGNTGGAFTIDSATGIIRIADSLDVDFSTNPTFSLTVQVADSASTPNTDTATIDIALIEVEAMNEVEVLFYLNDRFEYINTIYDGGDVPADGARGAENYKGLRPTATLEYAPVKRAIALLTDMAPLSTTMLTTVMNPTAYGAAQVDYTLHQTNLGQQWFQVYDGAKDAINFAREAVIAIDGDRLRVEGVRSLLAELDGFLAGLETRVNAELAKLTTLGALLLADDLVRYRTDGPYWTYFLNHALASAKLSDLRAQIATTTTGLSFAESIFNDAALEIQSDLDELDPNDEESAMGEARAIINALYDSAAGMILTHDDVSTTAYYEHKDDYYEALGDLFGSVAIISTDPEGNTYPDHPTDYRQSTNFGAMGELYAWVDELLDDTDYAIALMEAYGDYLVDEYELTDYVPDLFRSRGVASHLQTADNRLKVFEDDLTGGVTEATTGLIPQLTALFTLLDDPDPPQRSVLFLTAERFAVEKTYDFVLDGVYFVFDPEDPEDDINYRGVRDFYVEFTNRVNQLPA